MGGETERQSVFRKEYGADAKLTGDSPGAGAGIVSNEHGCGGLGWKNFRAAVLACVTARTRAVSLIVQS